MQGRRQDGRSYQNQPQLPKAPFMKVKVEYETHISQKHLTALLLDPATKHVVVGGFDGYLKFLDEQGQEIYKQKMGGPVDSLLVVGEMLFVGFNEWTTRKGMIAVIHIPTNKQQQQLEAHKGQVLSLLKYNNMLLSGGQDGSIRVWQFNDSTQQFSPMTEITQAQNGHREGVKALLQVQIANTDVLVSADLGGHIKLWDIGQGQCIHTIQNAHDIAITSMLVYQGALLTCGLDGHIKVWPFNPNPQPNAVLTTPPIVNQGAYDQQYYTQGRPPNYAKLPGVLNMIGFCCREQNLLLVSYNDESSCQIYDLPDFKLKGSIFRAYSARGLQASADGYIVTCDARGAVRMVRIME